MRRDAESKIYYENEKAGVRLYLGDCLEILPELEDESVDLIATDPPYFKVKDDEWDRQWSSASAFLDWLDRSIAEWRRLLASNGSLYCFASPQMAARVELRIAERFRVLNHIVWRKTASRAERNCKEALRMFFPASERIVFAEQYHAESVAANAAGYEAKCDELRGSVFEPLRLYLDGERERRGLTVRQVAEAFQKKTGSRTVTGMAGHWFKQSQWELPTAENYQWLRDLFNTSGGEYLKKDYEYLKRDYEELKKDYEELKKDYERLRRPFTVTASVPYTDVWTFRPVQATKDPGKHPCEKPADLMAHIVDASSRSGDLVLDPFLGSGATGVAAVEAGRKFVGIEKDEKYMKRAVRKIKDACRRGTFFRKAG